MYEDIEKQTWKRHAATSDEELDYGPGTAGGKKDEEEDDSEDEGFEEVNVSFACEDCDYRWEAAFETEEEADEIQICPMCGASNTTQI